MLTGPLQDATTKWKTRTVLTLCQAINWQFGKAETSSQVSHPPPHTLFHTKLMLFHTFHFSNGPAAIILVVPVELFIFVCLKDTRKKCFHTRPGNLCWVDYIHSVICIAVEKNSVMQYKWLPKRGKVAHEYCALWALVTGSSPHLNCRYRLLLYIHWEWGMWTEWD